MKQKMSFATFVMGILALTLLSTGTAHAQFSLQTDWQEDASSVFTRGNMRINLSGILASFADTLNVVADGNGSVSVEVYDTGGLLIGQATSPMSNEGMLTTALKVKMNPQIGTAAASCSQLGNVLTCNVFAPAPQGARSSIITFNLVVSVRGNVDGASLLVGPHLLSTFNGSGLGEVTIKYKATFSGGLLP